MRFRWQRFRASVVLNNGTRFNWMRDERAPDSSCMSEQDGERHVTITQFGGVHVRVLQNPMQEVMKWGYADTASTARRGSVFWACRPVTGTPRGHNCSSRART